MRISAAGSAAIDERQGAHERQVVLVGVGEDRGEVVRAVVGAFEPHVDAAGRRLHLLEHVGQAGAGPAGGRDGVVAPRLTGREWSHLEAAVAGALEGDGPLDRRQGAEVVERQGGRAARRRRRSSSVPSWAGRAKLLRT